MICRLLLAIPAIHAEEVDPDARAKELYRNGEELYSEGRYEDAIVAWEEAYRLSQRPVLLYNIANAEEKCGRYQAAMDHFNRYRAFATGDERELLDRKIRNLGQRIDEAGGTPTPTLVEPEPVAPVPVTTAVTAVTPKPARKGPPVATFVLGGVGVAGLASGAGFGLAAVSARGDAESLCLTVNEVTRCPTDAETSVLADRRNALIADISLGVGASSIISALIVALVDQPPPLVPGVGVWSGGGGLTLGGSF